MSDHFALAEALAKQGEPFVIATVVRAESPTSAKAGDKAIITHRGLIDGWVGGSCAEPTVLKEAKAALEDGECRLVQISPTADSSDAREGMKLYPMTCFSGGTLEIYIEPHVSLPLLLVFGNSPVARALGELGRVMNYRVTNVDLTERPPLPGNVIKDLEQLERLGPGPVYAVVATHGVFDEQALARAVLLRPHYLGLVASPRRAAGVKHTLLAQGVDAQDLERLRTPAGVEIGARTAEEIALSIMAEIVKVRRQTPALVGSQKFAQEDRKIGRPSRENSAAPAHDCCAHGAAAEHAKPSARVDRPHVSAILLAAGESRRMGGANKLLLPIDGVPLVRRTAETLLASGIEDVVAVLGFEATEVEHSLGGLPLRFVMNDAFREGQETSVRAGLSAIRPGTDGVMICLGDQPALRPDDIREIERAFIERKRGSVLVPMYRGTRGNPIVLDRHGLDQILARGGKFGCRQLTTHHADLVEPYEMSTDHVLKDIDRPEDYAALR
jgi:xanthine dehydrogenase accessory factor